MAKIIFDCSDKAREEIAALKDDLGARSYAEVIRRALKLLEAVQDARRDGGRVVVENGGERTELMTA